MFSFGNKNKLGLISSSAYLVLNFVYVCTSLFAQFSSNYSSNTFAYFVGVATQITALFIVLSLVKEFFKEGSIITVIIGVCIFAADSIFLQAEVLIFEKIFTNGGLLLNILTSICICVSQLFLSLRLISSPNLGRFVGFIGLLNVVVQIVLFILNRFYVYGTFLTCVSLISSLISAGVIFSYFLFCEED